MRVAQVRGVKFEKSAGGVMNPINRALCSEAFRALADVARALGYLSSKSYNDACIRRPAEVERRLKALGRKAAR